MSDIIVEGIKNFSISEKSLRQRMLLENQNLVNRYLDSGRGVLLIGGHYNNWELYALLLPLINGRKSFGSYTAIGNSFLNKKVKESRSKFGLQMVNSRELRRRLIEYQSEPIQVVFAADQSPSSSQKCHWVNFLNQETAVLTGAERLAKEFNLVVIYGTITKVKRGYYSTRYDLIAENPLNTKEGEITELHTKMLEKAILDKPEYWLWSHKRWKRKKSEV